MDPEATSQSIASPVEATERASKSMEISRRMVALLKSRVGRGPTRAKTVIRDDLVVCLLQDTLTPAERTLADSNQEQAVRDIRRMFQDALRDEAVAIVEQVTGQRVISFMSDHDIGPDFAAEIFALARKKYGDGGQPPPASG